MVVLYDAARYMSILFLKKMIYFLCTDVLKTSVTAFGVFFWKYIINKKLPQNSTQDGLGQ